MNNRNTQSNSNPMRVLKKFFLSAFVVLTFIAYALQKSNSSDAKVGLAGQQTTNTVPPQPPTNTAPAQDPAQPAAINPAPAATATGQPFFFPTPTTAAPTAVPPTAVQPTARAAAPQASKQNGQYKDGTYTGPEVDAIYGLVQVQAVIQNGRIASVQFLEYPNDRRTSVRINSYAVPTLQQEAVQVQSANVNLISGATLTSEGFQMSLQSALSKAKG